MPRIFSWCIKGVQRLVSQMGSLRVVRLLASPSLTAVAQAGVLMPHVGHLLWVLTGPASIEPEVRVGKPTWQGSRAQFSAVGLLALSAHVAGSLVLVFCTGR